MRTVSCNELYAMKPEDVSPGPRGLWGCYYNHLPEVSEYDLKDITADRMEIRTLKYADFDGRRIWHLATVWFDNEPVMVVQNAGREGDDHAQRFVTDWDRYRAMVTYLVSLSEYGGIGADTVDPDEQRDDLLSFYGEHFETVHLEVERQRIQRSVF